MKHRPLSLLLILCLCAALLPAAVFAEGNVIELNQTELDELLGEATPVNPNLNADSYENPLPGEGRFIHTYMHDGNPLPSFQGEPKLVEIPDDMDAFTDMLWNSLNEDNKVSLFARFIDIETGKYETKIVNKNM